MKRKQNDEKKAAGLGPESDPDMIRTPSLDEGADEDEGEDGTLLAESEDVGAWNEDEEEGRIDDGGPLPGDPSGYQAAPGKPSDAKPSESEKPDKPGSRWGQRK